jgi:hypothetical protein
MMRPCRIGHSGHLFKPSRGPGDGVIAGAPWLDQLGSSLWSLNHTQASLAGYIPPSLLPAADAAIKAHFGLPANGLVKPQFSRQIHGGLRLVVESSGVKNPRREQAGPQESDCEFRELSYRPTPITGDTRRTSIKESTAANGAIQVGVIADQTGPLSFMGIASANVARMVMGDIHAKGGLFGRKTTDSVAEANASKLVQQDHVDVVFGGIYSSTRLAIRAAANHPANNNRTGDK